MAVLHKLTNHSLLQPRLASLAEYHGAVGSVWWGCRDSNSDAIRQGVLSAPCLPFHHIPVALYRVSTPVRCDLLPGVEAIGVRMDSRHTSVPLPFLLEGYSGHRGIFVALSLSYPRLGVLPALDRSVPQTRIYSASIYTNTGARGPRFRSHGREPITAR